MLKAGSVLLMRPPGTEAAMLGNDLRDSDVSNGLSLLDDLL